MTRVLIALTSHSELGDTGRATGFYVSEAAEPWEVFTGAGFDVDLVSVKGGRPPLDGLDDTNPTQQKFLAAVDLDHTPVAADLDASAYDAVLFAGGHGAMWDFPQADDLLKLAADIYENGGVVAAVCHGPSALTNLKLSDGTYLVAGKNVAGFTNAEEETVGLTKVVPFLLADELTARGAIHHPADNWSAQSVVDGRLVTGQNPQSAELTAQNVLTALATR
jgi:putative intracellular protease/amidase